MSVRLRWSKHDITIHNVYAPTEQSSPDTKLKFWTALYRAKWRKIYRTSNVLLCDANGHVGKGHNPPGIGTQGQEDYNVNGHFFADLVSACDLAIVNTLCSYRGASSTTYKDTRVDYVCMPRSLLGYIDHSKSGVYKESLICVNKKDHFPVFLHWKDLPKVHDTLAKKKECNSKDGSDIDLPRLRADLKNYEENQTRASPLPLETNHIVELQNIFFDLRHNDTGASCGTSAWWSELYEHANGAAHQFYQRKKEEPKMPWIDLPLLEIIKCRRRARFKNNRMAFRQELLLDRTERSYNIPEKDPRRITPRTRHCIDCCIPRLDPFYLGSVFEAFCSSVRETSFKQIIYTKTYWSKIEYYDRVGTQMQTASDANDTKTVFECVRRLGGKRNKSGPAKQSVHRLPGVPELDPLKELNLFADHCGTTMGATRTEVPNPDICRSPVTGHILLALPGQTLHLRDPLCVLHTEIRRSILKGRMGRATKKNDVALEVWRALGMDAARELALGINTLHLHGFPEDWTRTPISWILKNGYPGHHPSQYRPIGILDQILKVHDRIIANRLQDKLSSILHDGEYGYAKGRSREQAMLHLELVLEICKQEGLSLAVLQTDISKAFDSVDRKQIYQAILEFCKCETLLHAVVLRHQTVLYVLSNAGEQLELFVPNGLVQGDSLGPLLWLLHYHRILQAELDARGPQTLQGEYEIADMYGGLWKKKVMLGDIIYADDHHILVPFKAGKSEPLLEFVKMAATHFDILNKHRASASISKSGAWFSLVGRGTKQLRRTVTEGLRIPGWGLLPTLPQLKILGGTFNGRSVSTEIQVRLKETRTANISLQKLWCSPECAEHTKLSVTNSISQSVLLSGLSCRYVTKVHQRKLESSHTRSLRRLSKSWHNNGGETNLQLRTRLGSSSICSVLRKQRLSLWKNMLSASNAGHSIVCLLFGQLQGFPKANLFLSPMVKQLLEDIEVLYGRCSTAHQEVRERFQGTYGSLQWLLALPKDALKSVSSPVSFVEDLRVEGSKNSSVQTKIKRRIYGKQKPTPDYYHHLLVYKCPICDKRWTTNGALQRHVRTHRLGRSPGQLVTTNKCPACQASFSSNASARRHFNSKVCPNSRTPAWNQYISMYLSGTQQHIEGGQMSILSYTQPLPVPLPV
jgi:hypothetical protein